MRLHGRGLITVIRTDNGLSREAHKAIAAAKKRGV